MSPALVLIALLFLFFTLQLHLALGKSVVWIVTREEGAADIPSEIAYVLGLLVHITLAFFLRCLFLEWPLATALPFLLCLFPLKELRSRFYYPHIKIDLNLSLWMGVHIALGVTLFQAIDGIETPWRNNYGDLAFHLGMIASFTLGEAGPPDFHLYPGVRLSYPFFVNFWSALNYWIAPSWYVLSCIFLFQWCVCWYLVYRFLDGAKNVLLPWALLFGGGSYFFLGQNSGPINDSVSPWTLFLTTIWVTQRSALLGTVVLLATCRLVFTWIDTRRDSLLLIACLLVALSPLVHTHIMLTGVLYGFLHIGLLLCFKKIAFQDVRDFVFRHPLFLLFCVVLTLSFLPWLIEKRSIVHLSNGWFGRGDASLAELQSSFMMWVKSAGPLFATFFVVWFFSKNHARMIPLILLFVVANIVQISVWEWDQIKVFLALYIIFLFIVGYTEERAVVRVQILFLALLFPALYEITTIFSKGDMHTIYTKEDLRIVRSLQAHTERGALIAGDPRHNSPIPLSGRAIYCGYDGTLHSHGIEYLDRKQKNGSLKDLLACEPENEICPEYLLFTQAERRLWKKSTLRSRKVKKTKASSLFEIVSSSETQYTSRR